MRCLPLLLSLLAWMQLVLAQNLTLQSAVKQLPQCAQLCLEGAVQQSSCKPTDAACICMDKELQLNVEACVLQACTLRQALTTKNATATVCHAPIRDSGNTVRVNNILLAVITVAIALIRLIYKAVFSIGELGWDDYTLFATLVCGAPSVIIIDRFALPNGLGRDVWTVGFDQITEFVKYLYVLEILYFLQISLLKLTLLFFFLRIFPNKTTKRLLWATVAFNCLNGVAFVVTAIFQCYPISFYWTKWDGEGTGKCVNVNALAWANAIITIALDIWMLVLPLHQVFQLQLSWRKKFGVTIMFCVGTFVTVISILRLRSLVTFAASNNPTWDQTAVVNWSNFEMNIGIICACLPALRVILVRMFPKILGTTKASEQPYYGTGSQSRATKRSGIASASRAEKSYTSSKSNPTAITYTKTFDVQHGDSDEQSLVNVEMSRLAHKKQSPSSSTSISSV